MLNFPTSSVYDKKVPKESFYRNMEISTSLKRSFVGDIDQITWMNKLSSKTINVGEGENVSEIEILQVQLKKKNCNYSIFEFIDRNLPQYTVFHLIFNKESQLVINYKEPVENKKGKFKITTSYKTNWEPTSEINLSIDGLNMDKVYESFVSQIGDESILVKDETDLKQSVEKTQLIEKLQRKIVVLENKKRKEKQFNLQLKYSNIIKELKNQISELL